MADAQRALGVWCFGRLAGTLVDASVGPSFAYEPAWVADDMPPLSQSLPLSGDFPPAAAARSSVACCRKAPRGSCWRAGSASA